LWVSGIGIPKINSIIDCPVISDLLNLVCFHFWQVLKDILQEFVQGAGNSPHNKQNIIHVQIKYMVMFVVSQIQYVVCIFRKDVDKQH